MAGIFFDGFDYYNRNGDDDLWSAVGVAQNYTTGRFGGSCLFQDPNGNGGGNRTLASMGLATTATTFLHSFALQLSVNPAASIIVFGYEDGTTSQVDIRINSSNQIVVTRNGTTLGTSTATVSAAQWHWIEVKFKIDNSTGTYEVRLDGTSVLSGSSVDTQNTANASITRVRFLPSGNSTSATISIDDFIFQDDNGGAPSFLGECRVITQLPTAAGTHTDLTPSTGSNWQNVDEVPRNGDTDYNSGSTSGNKDTYNFDAFGATGTILGIQVSIYARKDDVSTRKFKSIVRSGGTDYLGAEITPGSSYAYSRDQFLTDPNTGSAWTSSNLDAAEFGIDITA